MKAAKLLILITFGLPSVTLAREFRQFDTIATPKRLPKGTTPVAKPKPVKPQVMKDAVKDLMSSWNQGDFDQKLGDALYDKQRLLDSISEKVPRDAKVRVLGAQNIQTLQQYVQPAKNGTSAVVSRVSVTARTQIEYHDPKKGFQRIDGKNEYIFEVRVEEVQSE